LRTRFVLVCTGSRPAIPDIDGLDQVPYLTSDSLFASGRPPASLAIVGGGPQGVELGQAMVRLGVPVTLIEREPHLLTREEPDLSRRLTGVLEREGVAVRCSTDVRSVATAAGGVRLTTSTGEVSAAGLLFAAGRIANVDGLGLDALGIRVGADGAEVDGRSRTHVASIYVVGDAAAGRPRFTHAAAGDAVLAVRDMFFPGRSLASVLVPWCTFTDPELAHVGLTSDEARSRYGEHRVTVHHHALAENDRAKADDATDGAMVIVSARNRIVGAHALAPAAGELIHELALAIRFGFGLDELQRATRIYPTIATGISQILLERATTTARRYRIVAKAGRLLG
jgi:pyruvate/2-oxoglutarate dehydrogenase complex dihydrolipoamide dehydrogenase (E3) component